MEFREAMEVLDGPPMGNAVATAAGVTLSTISRARTLTENYRKPPKNWRVIVRDLASERAAALSALAAELADA